MFKLKKSTAVVADKPHEGSSWPAILVGSFAAFGGILYGYDTGSINGIIAMTMFKETFATHHDADGAPYLKSGQTSLIVSLLSVGTFCGAIAISFIGDMVGRRYSLIASCGVFCIGVILQCAASAIPLFIVGRVIAGFGVGLISAIVPLYQSEAAPKWIRGAIVSAYQFAITIGLLIASIVNQGTKNRTDSGAYRIPIAVQFAWALILSIGMVFLPESPRYYVKKGKLDSARRSLGRLHALPADHPFITEELLEIQTNNEYEMSFGKSSLIDCFKPEGRQLYRIFVGTSVQALQQLSGINFIFYYGTDFFEKSGISNPFTIQLITNIVNVVFTPPGMYAVEKLGRRNLLLLGSIGMCVCEYIVAIVGTAVDSVVASKVLIAFVCCYIAFFASSWGPVAWVVVGESFSLRTRAKSVAICAASNWLWNFGIGFATPYMVDSGPGNANLGAKVFFIWGTCCFASIFFVYFLIYETKGLTLEQVDELYEKVPKAWQSPSFVPSLGLAEADSAAANSEKPESENVEKVPLEV
ncbi:general substrate transporter [Lipomyces orientalis]|uniref:General substrate transporter n=1 Tax=Lipomyces orientalis TaxID=1233043 RepID=A0ACC3TLX0_9ASCO